MMKRLPQAGLFLAVLSLALLVVSAQAGTAKQSNKVKRTTGPISALAMDGPRVAYMLDNRRVGVWNVSTGASSTIKGDYPGKGHNFGYGSGEVAIAGKRVALITRFEIGNTLQTQERLYTASLGGSARQVGKLTNHSSSPGDCTVPGSGYATGNWLGGLVGSRNVLAVSSWKANEATATHARLNLIVRNGVRTIATGPGAIVSQSADGGHIAVLRSTDAWPAYQGPAGQSTPVVGVYSTHGRLLAEVAPDVSLPDPCGYPSTILRIALSGTQLVVLRVDIPRAGSLNSTLEVYDWKTGALVRTWPLALPHGSPVTDRVEVQGKVAVVEGGAFRLRLVDLVTGHASTVAASRAGSPATLSSRGLVYAVNPSEDTRHAKLVFVPLANLLRG